ncbi:hypothetical protein RRG08_001857 [Elysia crispata]|uniref:Uncharacterized protein n=1 Tax=Elysia crispata TaxID=231223 RepID=A0AAE1DRV8_9GAST|nr:hypothetical protein RRG08_001857 [Elysia crispata]
MKKRFAVMTSAIIQLQFQLGVQYISFYDEFTLRPPPSHLTAMSFQSSTTPTSFCGTGPPDQSWHLDYNFRLVALTVMSNAKKIDMCDGTPREPPVQAESRKLIVATVRGISTHREHYLLRISFRLP